MQSASYQIGKTNSFLSKYIILYNDVIQINSYDLFSNKIIHQRTNFTDLKILC